MVVWKNNPIKLTENIICSIFYLKKEKKA